MTTEQEALLRENNELLRELVSYVRFIQSAAYKDDMDMNAFAINVIADVFVDLMNKNNQK